MGAASDDGVPWLTAGPGEAVRWCGGPRIQTALPGAVIGVVVAAASVLVPEVPSLLGVAGVVPAAGVYLWVRNVEYVVTTDKLYRKQGVLGRRVTAVGYETVQNASYSQGILGTAFGYGTVTFDTAGGNGTELAFSNVTDPRAVEQLVSELLGEEESPADAAVPGSIEQWQAIREEVQRLRRTVEQRTDADRER
ncbi:PH domain-containing protein [Halorientalis litorea]|jgi:uncharacterized membrane protein YdbT with pleckstrin-like domain|uniref:PH domain-containing protein n=1 Tax=Halorientalis litorea TaxID=2931977 RepID=UPI001FF15F66|nr:PH domain-containing protein [Halorientalis litorea]